MAIYARFEYEGRHNYGLVNGGVIEELQGGLFDAHETGSYQTTGRQFTLDDVKLLAPCQPPKILAVGLNYKSHLGSRPAPANPEMFYKPVYVPAESGRSDPDSGRFRRRAFRRRTGGGDRKTGASRFARRSRGRGVRRHLRQRCERPQLAAQIRPAVVARERLRYFRASGPVDRDRPGLFRSGAADPRQRRGLAGAAHQRSAVRRPHRDQLRQPLRDAAARATLSTRAHPEIPGGWSRATWWKWNSKALACCATRWNNNHW